MLAALPAMAAAGPQLLYDNSNWTDQNLNGSQSISNGPVAAFLTTPNDQPHVYFWRQRHVHQHFYNGVSWSDDDLTLYPRIGGHVRLSGFSVATTSMLLCFPERSQHVHQLLYNNADGSTASDCAQ